MIIWLCACLFCILCFSCSSDIEKSARDGLYVINLDSTVNNKTSLPFSSVYKGIKTVILETNKSCLIGNINKIRVHGEYLYVLDMLIAKSLLVFDMEGNFIRKIGSVGQGPGEYTEPWDFAIDKENGIIYILDSRSQRINKYSITTGGYIHSFKLNINIRIHNIEFVGGRLYADAYFMKHSNDNYLLCSINDSTGKIDGKYLNVMKYNKGYSNTTSVDAQTFFLRENGNVMFTQRFMDHIIEINKDSIFSLFTIKSDDNFTPKDIKEIIEKRVSVDRGGGSSVVYQFKKFHKISDYIENGDKVMFSRMKGTAINNILYDKQTGETATIRGAVSGMLFKEQSRNDLFFLNLKLGCYDANGAYYHVSSREISKIKGYARDNALISDLDKLEKIRTLDDDANPIIFYYEFK